jgi:hypothetical protein
VKLSILCGIEHLYSKGGRRKWASLKNDFCGLEDDLFGQSCFYHFTQLFEIKGKRRENDTPHAQKKIGGIITFPISSLTPNSQHEHS